MVHANPGVEAVKKIRDAKMFTEFKTDPVTALKKVGVDTSQLKISQTTMAAGSTHAACVSVGCGICSTVG